MYISGVNPVQEMYKKNKVYISRVYTENYEMSAHQTRKSANKNFLLLYVVSCLESTGKQILLFFTNHPLSTVIVPKELHAVKKSTKTIFRDLVKICFILLLNMPNNIHLNRVTNYCHLYKLI